MSKTTLALLGGPKTIEKPFPPYISLGNEEINAARAVLDTKVLSAFYGSWDDAFWGGPKVKEFENNWKDFFGTDHAVTVNSATSGLIAAVGAIGLEPGDEVIVSPWTMCATATSILVWNGIPVFADIDKDTFNLDPLCIEKKITSRTKAIIVTDIFGHPAELDTIMALAKKHKLYVIEDAAQAPGALYKGKYAGTIADIGVYSLNYHKHIHTGEGGVCVTRNKEFAERMQLIRNHAEAVVKGKGVTNISNMIGFNFRLGEIESAIGIEQLKKLKKLAGQKTQAGSDLTQVLKNLEGLKTPAVKKDCTHVYYVYGLTVDTEQLQIPRELIIKALEAEGVTGLMSGYLNIHLLPIYQKQIAYGSNGFPWKSDIYKGHVDYSKGICPVAEKLHDETLIGLELCAHNFDNQEIKLVTEAFYKVWDNLKALKNLKEST